ncbi:MAG: hypothetical protein WDZ51_05435 [Pirellulaceae bacterium]
MSYQLSIRLTFVGGVMLALGCGAGEARPSAEIQGIVNLDGSPLEQGSVHFTSSRTGETAYANLAPGGTYSVSFPQVDLGEIYEVSVGKPVVDEQDAHALEANPPAAMTVRIPPIYSNRTTSGLSLAIDKKGVQRFDIDLKGP